MNKSDKISIKFPLKGEWQFLRPPGHHPYAFDFVKRDKKRKNYHKNSKLNLIFSNVKCDEYYCWNQPVYSPVNGEIIRIGTGWNDHQYTNLWKTISIWYNATYKFKPKEINGKLDIRPNAGNYVMIKTKEDFIVFLAHLKLNSVLVKEGQMVKVDEQIGNVGNSGNSTAPHLHINLFDQIENPFKAKVIPFVFKKYEELGKNNEWISKTFDVLTIKSQIRLN